MIDYKALAERANECLQQWEALEAWDISIEPWSFLEVLRTVVSLLEGMAEQEPAMWVQSNHLSWAGKQPFMVRCAPSQLHPDFVPLYLHPAPQPRPRRPYGTDTMSEMGIVPMCDEQQPERQPLTNEQIDEIGEPFGYFTYGDAQGDKRRAFVRAIESSHGIGYGKAIEGGPSELRSCTCHPDDNPPAPCAQQYALNECRAAQPERQPVSEPPEAQVEARDALLDFISENGTASEGVQHYLDRYVRAALAAKESK